MSGKHGDLISPVIFPLADCWADLVDIRNKVTAAFYLGGEDGRSELKPVAFGGENKARAVQNKRLSNLHQAVVWIC